MTLPDEIARAVKEHEVSLVRLFVMHHLLKFCFALKDGNKVVAQTFWHTLLYPGNHHFADESRNVFKNGQLIKSEIRPRSKVSLKLARPCAGWGFRSLGKSEDEDGNSARSGVGQHDFVSGEALSLNLWHLRCTLCQRQSNECEAANNDRDRREMSFVHKRNVTAKRAFSRFSYLLSAVAR